MYIDTNEFRFRPTVESEGDSGLLHGGVHLQVVRGMVRVSECRLRA